MLIGYARVSTDGQDLTAQRDALAELGVEPNRIYVDHGLTGTNRDRPGLRQALAACRTGDTLVVTKLDRLARSLPDARAIADELTAGQVKLNLGGSVHDPTDPVGRLLFNVLAMVAEFEADLIRLRTREGMRVAKAKGKLRGKQPKLNPRQEAHLVDLYRQGEHSTAELACAAIEMAVAARGGTDQIAGVIFHTDRGSTYTAERFTALCRRLGIRQSMGRVGSCFDNAAAEAFFSSLEWEVPSRHEFATIGAARATVIDWSYGFYNLQRRHSAAGGLSPINYETTALTRDAA